MNQLEYEMRKLAGRSIDGLTGQSHRHCSAFNKTFQRMLRLARPFTRAQHDPSCGGDHRLGSNRKSHRKSVSHLIDNAVASRYFAFQVRGVCIFYTGENRDFSSRRWANHASHGRGMGIFPAFTRFAQRGRFHQSPCCHCIRCSMRRRSPTRSSIRRSGSK